MPLTVGQERFFKTEWMPVLGAGGFNCAFAWEIAGSLDIRALADSLRDVGYRHDALRVRFALDNGEVRQCLTTGVPRMRTLDLSHLDTSDDAQAEARLVATEEAATPFDCSSGPLFRALLITLAPDKYVLVSVFHHSVFDGTSYYIWQRELTAIYRHRSTGAPLELHPAPSYADLVAKQRARVAQHRSYWASHVPKMPARLDLPVADREALNVLRPEVVPVSLGSVERLSTLCNRLHVSMSACSLAAFAALIARAARRSRIGLAVLFAGRLAPQERDAIGMFVTDLYAWADLSDNPPVGEFVSRIQAATLDAVLHEPCPADLVSAANDIPVINYISRRARPDEATSVFLDEMLESNEIELSPRIEVVTPAASTAGSLSMTLSETEEGLTGWLAYNHGRYERTDVEGFARDFEFLLNWLPDYCEARIDEIPFPEREVPASSCVAER